MCKFEGALDECVTVRKGRSERVNACEEIRNLFSFQTLMISGMVPGASTYGREAVTEVLERYTALISSGRKRRWDQNSGEPRCLLTWDEGQSRK